MSDHSAVPTVSVFSRYRKAVAAGLGALTPPVAAGLLALVGVNIDASVAAVLIGVLSPVIAVGSTVRAKPNAE
jgi:hypothetical protein